MPLKLNKISDTTIREDLANNRERVDFTKDWTRSRRRLSKAGKPGPMERLWVELSMLERGGPFEFLPGPEFNGRQPEWQPFGRHREARVHQDAANRVRSQTARLIPPAVYAFGYPDRVRVLPLIGDLGRVMEHKDGTIGGAHGR